MGLVPLQFVIRRDGRELGRIIFIPRSLGEREREREREVTCNHTHRERERGEIINRRDGVDE